MSNEITDLLSRLGAAGVYLGLGVLLLIAAGYVVDLLTPGHLMKHIGQEHSWSAAVVFAAAIIGQALVIFTAIWANADAGFGPALRDTLVFGALGILATAVGVTVFDLVIRFFTHEKLGDIVCVPGKAQPLALASAAVQIGVAALTVASIA